MLHISHGGLPDERNGTSYRKVVVLGITGSGKSPLAEGLAARIGAEYVDLDGLNHGPNWTPLPASSSRPGWPRSGGTVLGVRRQLHRPDQRDAVAQGRPDRVPGLALPLVLKRIVVRTVTRIVRCTELFNGNVERWSALFGRNSLLTWAVTSQRRHTRELPRRLTELAATGVAVVRLRSGRTAAQWLAEVPATAQVDRTPPQR